MNTALIARLARIQSELNAIMMELASPGAPPDSSPAVPVDEKKGPGRPRKEKKERDPNKPKKVLSPEHLAKLKEGRDLAVAKKAAEKAAASDDAASATSAASSDTEDGEVKVVAIAPPNAPKKGRGRPSKVTVEPIPAPDFSAAAESE
jgi:hypothetical protein